MSVFSKLDEDIITFHILPHLDGKTLIILSCVSSQFYNLICKSNNSDLWRNVCISTWPSLIISLPIRMLSQFICNNLPGGYRSFFSYAFPSIHPLNNPNPPIPPLHVLFYFAIDIFLEPEPKPFYSNQSCQLIKTREYKPHPLAHPLYFKCHLHHPYANFNFITVKKEGYEEYLKQKLTLSCVAVDLHGKRVGSLFNFGCRPVSVQPKIIRSIKAVYETVLPGPGPRPYNIYTEMVKCRLNVNFKWKGEGEDRFHVENAYLKMKDMNGKPVWGRHGAIVLLNAIGRKRGEEEDAQ